MQISKALPSDVGAIDKLVNSAYRGDYSKQGWTTEADILGGQRTDPDKLLEMISEKGSTIELLKDQGVLMGCVYLNLVNGEVYLGMLTVEPTTQAKGFGSILLKHAEAWAKEHGADKIRMTVINGRDTLMEYYQRRGYLLTGKTEPFPSEDPRFGLPKTDGLFFREMVKDL